VVSGVSVEEAPLTMNAPSLHPGEGEEPSVAVAAAPIRAVDRGAAVRIDA